ncbi:transglutaminase-like superfamily protein [Methanobrevibacter curvatus]|uniref:Transglutaminase-like superfamily protein n=1 Tax=Methanobrevibacter curvatus TaxID=49547 RepID=A0A166CPH2_9EURY|nr:transglutaminase-like superfamily protein [Methanobrevibacter curvatus]
MASNISIYFKSSLSDSLKKKYVNYLKSTPNCPNNNEKITGQIIKIFSTNLTGKITSYSKSVAIFNWVKQKEKYDFYENTKWGAVKSLDRILNTKDANMNCADHSHLVNAMLRTVGIPAFYGNAVCDFGSDNFPHYWSMAYIESSSKWVYLDAIHSYYKYDNPPWKIVSTNGRGAFYSVSDLKIKANIKLRR